MKVGSGGGKGATVSMHDMVWDPFQCTTWYGIGMGCEWWCADTGRGCEGVR